MRKAKRSSHGHEGICQNGFVVPHVFFLVPKLLHLLRSVHLSYPESGISHTLQLRVEGYGW